ncbi:hypothetical protein PanWU01x14_253380 [Parasponia andersonii]|uniref:Uncharacterized protein n=1 Tax=Parasponia andersonii TaxID=3476 RepID=A0A2P5BBP4_PARAD|nr:hypothetical protein PanWU01x14_253380 [Parasponia andersonii]
MAACYHETAVQRHEMELWHYGNSATEPCHLSLGTAVLWSDVATPILELRRQLGAAVPNCFSIYSHLMVLLHTTKMLFVGLCSQLITITLI